MYNYLTRISIERCHYGQHFSSTVMTGKFKDHNNLNALRSHTFICYHSNFASRSLFTTYLALTHNRLENNPTTVVGFLLILKVANSPSLPLGNTHVFH